MSSSIHKFSRGLENKHIAGNDANTTGFVSPHESGFTPSPYKQLSMAPTTAPGHAPGTRVANDLTATLGAFGADLKEFVRAGHIDPSDTIDTLLRRVSISKTPSPEITRHLPTPTSTVRSNDKPATASFSMNSFDRNIWNDYPGTSVDCEPHPSRPLGPKFLHDMPFNNTYASSNLAVPRFIQEADSNKGHTAPATYTPSIASNLSEQPRGLGSAARLGGVSQDPMPHLHARLQNRDVLKLHQSSGLHPAPARLEQLRLTDNDRHHLGYDPLELRYLQSEDELRERCAPRTSDPLQSQEHTQSPAKRTFRPMRALADGAFSTESLSEALDSSVMSSGKPRFSDNYRGMHTARNASDESVTDKENCSLWLTNLHPMTQYNEILKLFYGFGRVYCCYINGPNPEKGHYTAASKIVFFKQGPAQRFLQYWQQTQPSLRGHQFKVQLNRIKHRELSTPNNESRVVRITGDERFVNTTSLRAWFSRLFIYQEDEVIELYKAGGRAVVEFRFGSYRCQAQHAKMSLEVNRPLGFEKVEFADDPCEFGENPSRFAGSRL